MKVTVDPTLRYLGSHAELMVLLTRLHLFAQMGHLIAPERQRFNACDLIKSINAAIVEHHAEEEQELFVALRAQSVSEEDKQLTISLTNRLTRDHRSIEKIWAPICQCLIALLDGSPVLPQAKDCGELAARYQQHATFEETVMLPLARRLLLNDSAGSLAELNHRIDDLPGFI